MVTIVTLKDVARSCGVSASTVSRAFDENSPISQSVRQRILKCAADMGYKPNLIARSLKSRHTMTVAFIVPSIENSFYIDVLKYLEIKLHQYGYRLLVSFIQEGISTELDCLQLAASAQVDGIIFIPGCCENAQYIASLQNNIQFIQLFHAPYSEIDSVVMDDERGAEDGTNYLLRHHHQRIMFVGDDLRRNGFFRAIDAAGIPKENIRTFPYHVTADELSVAIRSFSPTAMFSMAATNETVWSAVQKLGLSIPDDVSIIAYDNTKWVSLASLTTVAHDLENIAATLVAQLLNRMQGDTDSPAQHIVLNPFIIERKSVQDAP